MKSLASVAISLLLTVSAGVSSQGWENLGYCRVTQYCPACNDPAGHQSSSGVYLTDGCAACNWLDIGTVIEIDGVEYTIVDYCGTDAIDLFIDSDSDECVCYMNEYKEVWRKTDD